MKTLEFAFETDLWGDWEPVTVVFRPTVDMYTDKLYDMDFLYLVRPTASLFEYREADLTGAFGKLAIDVIREWETRAFTELQESNHWRRKLW